MNLFISYNLKFENIILTALWKLKRLRGEIRGQSGYHLISHSSQYLFIPFLKNRKGYPLSSFAV
jgi:hypothetical protein